jgi:DNA replicative helicase MCM subunit Mcm2 (Cdc46/Mcm family)
MKTHPTAKKYGVMNELLDERHQTAEKYDLHLVKRYIKHARDTCRPQMTGANT